MGLIRDLGPCQVLWNSIDLGPTHGGVKYKLADSAKDIFEDGQGETPVDSVFIGVIVGPVEVPLTRLTEPQLDADWPGTSDVGGVLHISNVVGEAMYDQAHDLVLKPLINDVPSVDPTEWVTFWKTYPMRDAEVVYDNAGQRVFLTKFKIFPSDVSGQVGEFGKIGV